VVCQRGTQHSCRSRRRPTLSGRLGSVVAAYSLAVTMLGTTLPTPLYPIYRQEYGFSQLTVTLVFATYSVGVITALLLFGGLSDQIGRRRLMLPGLALAALSALSFLFAQGLGLLLMGRLLSGLSAGIFTGTATAMIVELAAPENRGRATLLATSANLGGLGCGALLAGLLAEYAGSPRRLSFVVDLVLLVPAATTVWLVPESVQTLGRLRLRLQRPTVSAQVRPVFVQAAIVAFAGFSVLGLFTAIAPSFLGEVLDVQNHAVAGLLVFAVFAASTVGQLCLERVPESRGLPLGCVGLAVGMALFALGLAVSSLTLLVIGGCVSGLGQGLSFRGALIAVNDVSPPEQRASVVSAFFVVAYVAVSLPVVDVGVLEQVTNIRVAGLAFAGVVIMLALVALALLRRRSNEDQLQHRSATG
jgi:MFS family permease